MIETGKGHPINQKIYKLSYSNRCDNVCISVVSAKVIVIHMTVVHVVISNIRT